MGDNKLDLVRKSNVALLQENDELNNALNEVKRELNDLKESSKERQSKYKSTVSKYEATQSQLIGQCNNAVSDKLGKEADLEQSKEENNKLSLELSELKIKYDQVCEQYNDYKIKTIKNGISYDVKAGDYLIELDIKKDELYQFVTRCRNYFKNTNKLTKSMTIKLIEGCARFIMLFHQSKNQFAHFIAKSEGINQRFHNIQDMISQKYSPFTG